METTTRTPIGRLLGVTVGLALIVGVITLAFAWPASDMGPHDIPIAVVGPEQAADRVAAQIDQARPGAFEVTSAATADEARTMIERREVYAALEPGTDGIALYTAGAASPVVARLIQGMAEQMAAGQGLEVTVEDVIPMPEDDPNGAGLAASAFPMAAGGLVIAALIAFNVRGTGRQVFVAALAPPVVAAAVAAILIHLLGAVDGDYWTVAGAVALGLYGASWAVLGLAKLLGRAGLALGAILVMLVGNPLSGMASAPELLPAPWGQVGQYLAPGAGATLLRSAAFFDGHGGGAAVAVLASWMAAGAVLFVLGAVRRRATALQAPGEEPVAVPV